MDNLTQWPRASTPWAPPVGFSPTKGVPANSNFSNAGSAPVSNGTAHPQDVFCGSGSPLQLAPPSAKDIQAHIGAAQAEKDKIISSLMKQGVGQPTGAEQQNLNKELSSIDTEVLSLVAKNGTKMGVASPGDNLVALGAITPLTQSGSKPVNPSGTPALRR